MSSVCSAFSRPARCFDRGLRGALRLGPRAALACVALLASCQPLPHPFADDRPPAELLAVPESAGISIAPIEGEPSAIASRLGAATARALLGREIPASDKTSLRGSYQLQGGMTASRLRRGQSSVAVLWRLEDAQGRKIGEREVRIEATADDWQAAGGAMIDRLAALSADAVAPLLVRTPAPPKLAALAAPMPGPAEPDAVPPGPPPAKPSLPESSAVKPTIPALPAEVGSGRKPDGGRRLVVVRRVTGAPGDGATSLARAVTSVLRQQDLTIVEPGGKADFVIDGEVAISPAGPDKQQVKIVWRVRDASGAELGTVAQENDVPRGLLSGPWGDVAYVVAAAAGDGLSQIFARAAPSTNSDAHATAATGAASTARQPPHADPGQAPSGRTSQPAASRVKAAKTKEQR